MPVSPADLFFDSATPLTLATGYSSETWGVVGDSGGTVTKTVNLSLAVTDSTRAGRFDFMYELAHSQEGGAVTYLTICDNREAEVEICRDSVSSFDMPGLSPSVSYNFNLRVTSFDGLELLESSPQILYITPQGM